MIVKMLTLGTLYTNCYIVGCTETREALIIDLGFEGNEEAERVLREVNQHGLQVKYIVNTHGHPDHIGGNGIIKKATGALILIHEYDAPMLTGGADNVCGLFRLRATSPPADRMLQEGDVIQAGKTTLRVLHTPGHSKGSISLLGDDVFHWRYVVCRVYRQMRSPKRIIQRNYTFHQKVSNATGACESISWTRSDIHNRKREKQQ